MPDAFSARSSRSDDIRPNTIMTAARMLAGMVSVRISGMPRNINFAARYMGRLVYMSPWRTRTMFTARRRKVRTPRIAAERIRISR